MKGFHLQFILCNISRYWHTARYLRSSQIWFRFWRKLYRPKLCLSVTPILRAMKGMWASSVQKPISMLGANRFSFLNQEQVLGEGRDWNYSEWPKLWLYNLHYFDDLNASAAADRKKWHSDLIQRWIDENPPSLGNGWEPYPISLRLVNWIKWGLNANPLSDGAIQSLMLQVRWLHHNLEYHLLGNHLFANGKALFFAGLFFEGKEADYWLKKGLTILNKEIEEQVLSDGGHFERSPMYHAIILEDLLDLINLSNAYGRRVDQQWLTAIAMMRTWLAGMSHPDGRIALFNDAAFGIAPIWHELDAYARRLQLGLSEYDFPLLTNFPDSGYIRLQGLQAVALLDVASVGPDYIPGHAHADTLSFELSVFGQRVLVNSGTSTYEKTAERHRQRGTAAHNTVSVNGQDSSEVWGGFRVARRARPFGLETREDVDSCFVKCAHDGYRRLPGKPVHWRQWHWMEGSLVVRDTIDGPFEKACARYYFHPEVKLVSEGLWCQGRVILPSGHEVCWQVNNGQATLMDSTWHPEFGITISNRCLEIALDGPTAEVVFSW